MNLINKAALVAEIERRIKSANSCPFRTAELGSEKLNEGQLKAYNAILSFINTLEVKDVDLEKSARHYLLHEHLSPLNNILHQADLKTEMQYHKDIETAFKAGFELGLKAQKEIK